MTNFERIKGMSVEEMGDFIFDIYSSNENKEICVGGKWIYPENIEECLESEVEK